MKEDVALGDPAKLAAEVDECRRRNPALKPLIALEGVTSVADEIRVTIQALCPSLPRLSAAEVDELDVKSAAESKRMAAELVRSRRRAQWASMCPPRYRETFDLSKVDAAVDRKEIAAVLEWEFQGEGLFVIGETSKSKTRALYTLLERHFVLEEREVKVLDGIQFGNDAAKAFSDPATTEQWLRGMVTPAILAIDDLGKRLTPSAQQALFAVIERRGSKMKPLLVTTNCRGDSLRGMITDADMAEPLIRRLKQYCKVVVF